MPVFPGAGWSARAPAQLLMDAARLDAFKTAVGARNLFITRHGYQAYSFNAAVRFNWASAVKPVYSCMLFAARKRGLIPGGPGDWPDVTVPAFMPEWELTEADRAISIHHLVNMVSGYALPEAPGRAWAYNDYGVSMAQRVLFNGIFDVSAAGADALVRDTLKLGWQDGKVLGARNGYGMATSCRDAARLGLFWLRKGKWRGTQVLPADHFTMWRKVHVPAGFPRSQAPDAGGAGKTLAADYLNIKSTGGGCNQAFDGRGCYGFFWWINTSRKMWPGAPADAFAAIGHFNQEVILVVPSWGIVATWRGKNSTPASQKADMDRYLAILRSSLKDTS